MDGALHVLVVDDDPDTALFVRTVLQRGGMTVTTCADPLVALGRPLPATVPFTDLAVGRQLEDLFLPSADLVAEEADR